MRNIEALKSSPFVNTGTKRTPHGQQQPDYIISPFRCVWVCLRWHGVPE
jgi:hypothetical protein